MNVPHLHSPIVRRRVLPGPGQSAGAVMYRDDRCIWLVTVWFWNHWKLHHWHRASFSWSGKNLQNAIWLYTCNIFNHSRKTKHYNYQGLITVNNDFTITFTISNILKYSWIESLSKIININHLSHMNLLTKQVLQWIFSANKKSKWFYNE